MTGKLGARNLEESELQLSTHEISVDLEMVSLEVIRLLSCLTSVFQLRHKGLEFNCVLWVRINIVFFCLCSTCL
jgi:hypothetical protein